jgi:hypothetical protein
MCQVKGGLSIRDIDQCPPLTMITAAQSWGIPNTMIHSMIRDLKSCLTGWWESLPRQEKGRMWLKKTGNPFAKKAVALKEKVELMMRPYLDYVSKQNTSMTVIWEGRNP